MPLDGAELTPRDRRRALVALLRDPPPDHRWDFTVLGGRAMCGSVGCALGLAVARGLVPEDTAFGSLLRDEGRSYEDYERRLLILQHFPNSDLHPVYGVPSEQVTPAMVADALEALDAEG